MKRRTFLAATAVTAAWPSWLARSFGATIPTAPQNTGPLFTQLLTRARATQRLLLVLVIPHDLGQRYERGHLFGAWLNYGSDHELAPLHACEVVCVKMKDVLLPHSGPGEPLMLLIDPSTLALTRIDPRLPRSTRNDQPFGRTSDELEEKRLRQSFAMLASLLGDAVPAQLPEHAAAREVRKRLVEQRIPGSRWAIATGCGDDIEGGEPANVGCGMGHLPEVSRRFLYWFKGNGFPPAGD